MEPEQLYSSFKTEPFQLVLGGIQNSFLLLIDDSAGNPLVQVALPIMPALASRKPLFKPLVAGHLLRGKFT
jgi:hypothetical protein